MNPVVATTADKTVVLRETEGEAVVSPTVPVVSAPVAAASEAAVIAASAEAEADLAAAQAGAKCSTLSVPSVARRRKFPSSPVDHVPFIAAIASHPTARHVVAAVVAADSAAVVTAVVVETAAPAATSLWVR